MINLNRPHQLNDHQRLANKYTDTNMSYCINLDLLPQKFPTHRHDAIFWEHLGRTIATFGFLEEILGKAIFAFTAMKRYDISENDIKYNNCLKTFQHALSDELGRLIKSYHNAIINNPEIHVFNLNEFIEKLNSAKDIRNVLCHGSWRIPNQTGASIPLFVNNKNEIFDTEIDIEFLDQVQKHVADLSCNVINTVTANGWKFPGSSGPGIVIWK